MGTGCWYFALHLLKTFVCLVWSKTPQSIWSIPIFVSKTSLLYFPKVKLLRCDRISLVFLRDCIINLYYMIYCSVWKTFAKPFRLHRFALLLLELQFMWNPDMVGIKIREILNPVGNYIINYTDNNDLRNWSVISNAKYVGLDICDCLSRIQDVRSLCHIRQLKEVMTL